MMKRTNMITVTSSGKIRKILRDEDGRLYYRECGTLHGTFEEYCFTDDASGWMALTERRNA